MPVSDSPVRRIKVDKSRLTPKFTLANHVSPERASPFRASFELIIEGLSFETIIQDYYPDLAIEDFHACMQHK